MHCVRRVTCAGQRDIFSPAMGNRVVFCLNALVYCFVLRYFGDEDGRARDRVAMISMEGWRETEYKIVQLKTYNYNTTAKARGLEFSRQFGWSWRSSRRIFKRSVRIKLKIMTCR